MHQIDNDKITFNLYTRMPSENDRFLLLNLIDVRKRRQHDKMTFLNLYVLLVFQIVSYTNCLNCKTCQGVANPALCNISASCLPNEVCYLEVQQNSYTLGCSSSQNCGATSVNIIGRDINQNTNGNDAVDKTLATRQASICHECCSTDECNRDLCNHLNPTRCIDDETVDCAKLSTIFNICHTIHKAKLVCAKFCNLCDLVDGQWGQWTAWTGCDVTCNTGKQIRTRQCNNPKPAHGGLECTGNRNETKSCHNKLCPVDGNWSDWSSWGSCSVTCGIGLKRRDRSCSSPPPSIAGNHCFGDAHENKICFSSPCTDGAWSTWSSWGDCSETCGGGLRIKTRTCSNPPPSVLGKHCEGKDETVGMCNRNTCPDHKVAFTAYGLKLGVNKTIVFPNVHLNSGGGYDKQTGIFTCNIPGIYQFTVSLTMSHVMHNHVFQCYLNINSSKKLFIEGFKTTSDLDALEYSASGSFHLNKNDTVYIYNSLLYLPDAYNGMSSSFTGVLVIPDI